MARTIKTTLELGGESAYKKGLQSIDHALVEQDWLQVGIDIVRGLADGLIDGVNIIWDKIKEMASSLLSGIKNALGIHSPSKLFRDKVGIFLAQGVGVGFVDEMDKVTKDMQNALPTSFDTMVNADISSFSNTKNHNLSLIHISEPTRP